MRPPAFQLFHVEGSDLPADDHAAWNPIHGLAALALAGLFLFVNGVTAANYPAWTDDVMQIDAGVNLALGRGWSSTAWQSQSGSSFWAANNPLFPLLLSGWVSLFGFSLPTVRLFGCVLSAATAGVIVNTAWRARWVTSPWLAIALGVLLLCDFGHAIVYRSGRADVMPMLIAALLARAWLTVPDETSRRRQLFLFSMFLVPSGLHVIPYVAILIACDAVLRRRLAMTEILTCAVGCAIGGACTLAVFAWHGQVLTFVSQTAASGYNIVGAALQAVVIGDAAAHARLLAMLQTLLPASIAKSVLMNSSLLPMLLALLFAIAAARIAQRPDIRIVGVAGLAIGGSVVLGMLLAGRFPIYYAWMASLPVGVAVLTALQKFVDARQRLAVAALVIAAAVAIGVGLPRALLDEVRSGGPGLTRLVHSIAAAELRQDDVIYGDPLFYYETKNRGLQFYSSTTYAGGRGYPEIAKTERDSITLLLVDRGEEAAAVAKLGGAWELTRAYTVGPTQRPAALLALRRRGG